MSDNTLILLIRIAGIAQFGILIASALVPFQLNWKGVFAALPKLHRQMYWVYGGYVVLSIIALAVITTLNARALADGSLLARSVCGYAAVFWGVRLSLQGVLDAKPLLKTCWLTAGYHGLTLVFLYVTLVMGYAALRPG